GGCAASAVLDVGYPSATTQSVRPPAQARRVVIQPVADQRMDRTRIGPAAEDGQAMVTRRPVTDIVREALAVALTRAGYSVVAERGDVAVTPEVEEFWIDVVNGYRTTLYVGRVAIALAVVDGVTGNPVQIRRYVATSRREVDGASPGAARDALEVAL